jgi:IclR family transcriptional regulator, KDG regulon repressor
MTDNKKLLSVIKLIRSPSVFKLTFVDELNTRHVTRYEMAFHQMKHETKPKISPPRRLYRVQSLDRALDILECFSFQKREFSLAGLAQGTGLNKTTVLRLASNLVNRGYLKFDPATGSYCLGVKLFELGSIVFSSFSLRKAAATHMTELQQKTSATVLLGAHMDDQLTYLDKREGDNAVRIASEIGWRRAPHHGMLGMVLMAWLPEDRQAELLDKYPLSPVTSRTITDLKTFCLRLSEIVRTGYGVEHGEAVEGVTGVAAPIRDYSRGVIGAIGVALVDSQHDETSMTRAITAVRSAAHLISLELGYVNFRED